jgi:predicted AlkP superfamily phosphohydrolase/phosphomutase
MRGPGRVPTLGGRRLDLGPSFAGPASGSRVVMVVVDGASLDFISPAAADGRLPNFGRLLDNGASLHLATLRPTQPDPVWTSVATGKLPVHHGVRSSGLYTARQGGPTFDLLPDYCFAHALVYFGFLAEVPQTSASLRVRPIWSVLGGSGIVSAVVRWPLTFPVQPLQGVMVSDRLHLAPDSSLDLGESAATYPADLLATIRARPGQQEVADAALSLYGSTQEPYAGAGALALDRLYASVFDGVWDQPGVRFAALRYQGLDVAGHYYLRQAMPRAFGEVSGDDRRTAGRVLEQYYRFLDGELGRALERLGPDDLLLVVSAFGMEPLSLPKRLIDRAFGSGTLSGTHERAPDGFLIAFGRSVQPGRLQRSSVLDVTPTVLYFFGLPIGRDMDGYARTDIFTRAFIADRPLTYIPTYER